MEHIQQNYNLNQAHWQQYKSASWQKTTVTFSFADFNASRERITFDKFIAQSSFKAAIRAATADWEEVANIDFVEVGDSSGVDVRIGLADLDGARGVLATTDYYFRNSMMSEAYIRFDTAEDWQNSLTSTNQTPTYLVALHELGHALGLAHSQTGDDTVMLAVLNRNADGLGADDIAGIHALYGAAVDRIASQKLASADADDHGAHEDEATGAAPTQSAPSIPSDSTEALIYRLYDAAFDRAPDAGGLEFWMDVADGALDFSSVAETMMQSEEFLAVYAIVETNQDFVAKLYENVLDRPGDAEGAAYWSAVIDSSALSRADVLVTFAESDENIAHESRAFEADILSF